MAIAQEAIKLLCVFIFSIETLAFGLTTLEPSPIIGRVVGGSNAAVNSAPFIVSFQQKGIHYCAGCIINKNWIVTAAHCLLSKIQVKSTTLVAGSISVTGKASTTQTRSIDHYVINDLYLGGTSPYDIGLVYTKTPFVWSSAVSAVVLPPSSSTPTGNSLLYGWGSTSKTNNAKYPTDLQVATVPIITLKACESALGPKGHDVHNTNLCTGPLSGGVGICTSDSGGPLIQKLNGNNVLIGIVSWGKLPCGQSNSPSVFVKVSSFISWIAENQVVPK